jgi:O-methyltransferase
MTAAQKVAHAARLKVHDAIAHLHYGLANYGLPARKPVLDAILAVKRERKLEATLVDAYQLVAAAKSTAKLSGSVAEVGVYKGASAKLIMEAIPNKPIHLCDTFEGLPEAQDGFDKGQYCGTLEEVKQYLDEPRVHYHRGYFPRDTGHEIANERFCFVHLDVDYYDGTYAALEFFWPRMVTGGIVLTHDYIWLPGPTKAFDDFFRDRIEPVVEVAGIQAMVVKAS